MSTVAGTVVTAIESVWAHLRIVHPDVPDVVVAMAGGSAGRRGVRLGQFGPDRWQRGEEWMPELFIGGEGFAFGAREVLATLLHEAAHGLARARGISDTSRAGAYHNGKYRQLAEELGLRVERQPSTGWSITHLADDTAEKYRTQIENLAAALTAHRRSEHTGTEDPDPAGEDAESRESDDEEHPPRNGRALTCGCTPPRRVRAHQRSIDPGPILCGVCEHPFAA
ncbi:hypothetical protein [Nocardia sp. NPDC050435]|uniref:hypothetical protein n=1 Tax=Nocardia sp. NPDC050435 TaxID=3155040 RepID=UPI0033FD98FA